MVDLIRDENGKLSSSRVVLFLFVLAFFLTLFVDGVPDISITTIQQVIILCLGTAGARAVIRNAKQ